jgi:hypothetical protein
MSKLMDTDLIWGLLASSSVKKLPGYILLGGGWVVGWLICVLFVVFGDSATMCSSFESPSALPRLADSSESAPSVPSLSGTTLEEKFTSRIDIPNFAKAFSAGECLQLPLLRTNRAVFRIDLIKTTSHIDMQFCRVDEGTDASPVYAKVDFQMGSRLRATRETRVSNWMVRAGIVQNDDMACNVNSFKKMLSEEEVKSVMAAGSEKAVLTVTRMLKLRFLYICGVLLGTVLLFVAGVARCSYCL